MKPNHSYNGTPGGSSKRGLMQNEHHKGTGKKERGDERVRGDEGKETQIGEAMSKEKKKDKVWYLLGRILE